MTGNMWRSALSLLLLLLAEEQVSSFAPGSFTKSLLVQSRQFGTKSLQKMTVSQTVEGGEASVTPVSAPDMDAFANGYKTVFDEQLCKVCSPTEGAVPDDLVGTYFRCGPAMFSAGSIVPPKTSILQPKQPPVPDGKDMDRMVKHPFEGDGAVLAVTFPGDGTATSRFRFVRTTAFTNERKAGKKLYKGMDSTREMGSSVGNGQGNDLNLPMFRHHLQPGLNKKRKNTSNTRTIYWGKRLLTLWEGGLPYKLDALSLDTEGRSQLGGVLKEQDPLGGKAVYDSNKNRMLLFQNIQEAGSADLTVMEFNSKFRPVTEGGGKSTATLKGFAALSDFGVTENYAVFIQPPVTAKGMQFLVSKEPGKTLDVESGAASLHLLPRPGSGKGELRTFSIPMDADSDAEVHFCNAYENGDNIVIDAIRSNSKNVSGNKAASWPWASSLDDYSRSTCKRSLWRYTVNVKTGAISKEMLTDTQSYFGVVNPSVSAQKHRFIYTAIGSMDSDVAPPQGIAKFDCETKSTDVWMPQEFEFCGEPMYADRKMEEGQVAGEDDGYILSVLFNGKTEQSEMIVLRANNISAGPVSRIPLGLGVPHGLFGCFSSAEETNWGAEEIERRAKLALKMESRGNMWNEVKSDFSGLGLRLDDMEEYFGDMM